MPLRADRCQNRTAVGGRCAGVWGHVLRWRFRVGNGRQIRRLVASWVANADNACISFHAH
jgi:hypothetical protein